MTPQTFRKPTDRVPLRDPRDTRRRIDPCFAIGLVILTALVATVLLAIRNTH